MKDEMHDEVLVCHHRHGERQQLEDPARRPSPEHPRPGEKLERAESPRCMQIERAQPAVAAEPEPPVNREAERARREQQPDRDVGRADGALHLAASAVVIEVGLAVNICHAGVGTVMDIILAARAAPRPPALPTLRASGYFAVAPLAAVNSPARA